MHDNILACHGRVNNSKTLYCTRRCNVDCPLDHRRRVTKVRNITTMGFRGEQDLSIDLRDRGRVAIWTRVTELGLPS